MNFLALLAERVLELVFGRLVDWARNYFAEKAKQKQEAIDAAESVRKLKEARTAQEIDDAARDALNRM